MRHLLCLFCVALLGCDDPSKGNNSNRGTGSSGGTNSSAGGGTNSSGGGTNSGGGSSSCAPSSPGALFSDALCLCGGLHDIGNLIVDGAVGVNRVSRLANHTGISDSFSVGEDLDAAGDLSVQNDLSVAGDLLGIGRVAVGGVLRIRGADDMIGWQQAGSRGSFSATQPPCSCDMPFNVAAAVALAKSSSATTVLSNSPSATIGIDPITLASGTYFSADAATLGYQQLHVTGAVSLFVDGTLDEIGADRIVIDPGASLDLYVSAGVNTVGYAGLGDQTAPASFRLYVGGSAPVTLSVGAQWFHGSIYAPQANIVYVGDTHVAGGLFAHELVGTGQLVISGALPGSPSGGGCPPTLPPVS
jgi:hypothetical protein